MRMPGNSELCAPYQTGRCRNADDFDQVVNWAIRVKQISRLENGPKAKLPSWSIAYHPFSMPRRSDWRSLMYWGVWRFAGPRS